MPSEEDRVMAAGNMHENLVQIGHAVFELRVRTDTRIHRETHRQRDKQQYSSQYFAKEKKRKRYIKLAGQAGRTG